MKVIFVHGRSQQHLAPRQLRANWLTAWEKGLAKSGLVLPAEDHIHIPYYADVLEHYLQQDALLPKEEVTRGTTIRRGEAHEIEFTQDFLREMANQTAQTPEERYAVDQMDIRYRGPQNWEVVQRLASYLDRSMLLGDYPIRKVVRDVYLYLTEPQIKEGVNRIVEREFDDSPCVVVGHSLGSIVTYLVLKNNPEYKVKKYITIGSPLGLRTLAAYLEPPLVMPSSIVGDAPDRWYNVYDERDFIALHPLDAKHFNNGFDIVNSTHVRNHTSNRHGIAGYLDDEVVAKLIYDAMHEE